MRPRFRSRLTYSDVVEYVGWLRESAMFVLDAPPLEDWLAAKIPDPDDAYLLALAREYRADYLVTGDHGLLGVSNLFASATLDLPNLAVLTLGASFSRSNPREAEAHSPNCTECAFCELRLEGVLGSSPSLPRAVRNGLASGLR